MEAARGVHQLAIQRSEPLHEQLQQRATALAFAESVPMTETQMLTVAATLVAALFGLLATIVGWMGSRVIEKLDKVVEKLNDVAGELHERINGLDRRVTVVETRCTTNHPK